MEFRSSTQWAFYTLDYVSGVKNPLVEETQNSTSRYTNIYSNIKDKSLTRREQVLLAQLRCGECKTVGKYLHRLGKSSGICRWCKEEEETVHHLYETCNDPGLKLLRNTTGIKDSTSLVKEGRKALEFLEKAMDLL